MAIIPTKSTTEAREAASCMNVFNMFASILDNDSD